MTRSVDKLAIATCVIIAVEAILAVLILSIRGDLLPLLPFVAWPMSGVGVILAAALAIRHWRRDRDGPHRSAGAVWLAGIAAVALAVGHTYMVDAVFQACSRYAKSLVAQSNLRGIGETVKLLCQKNGNYPASLGYLVEVGELTPKQLISYRDPNVAGVDLHEPVLRYSSFEYCPGVGPWRDEHDVILAHEREAWSSLEVRVFAKRGRCVLFGDGRVDILDAGEFAAAIQRDRERRGELGWPVCE